MGWNGTKTWAVGDPGTSADLNAFVRDNAAFLYGDSAWITVSSFQDSWVAVSGYPVQYRATGAHVMLRGALQSGTLNTQAFLLPSGYTPAGAARFFACYGSGGTFAGVEIATNGVVTPTAGSTGGIWFDGIIFDTI